MMQGDDPQAWQDEIVRRYAQLKDDLRRTRQEGSLQMLVLVLRSGGELLHDITEDDRLWAWIDVHLARAREEATPEALARILQELDAIVETEYELLVAAGLPPEDARELAESTRLTSYDYAERSREGRDFDSSELRPALAELARAAFGAEAALQRSIDEKPEPGLFKRFLGVAGRVVGGGGGVAQIVVDAGAAKFTFGATLLSMLSGAKDALEAAKGD